MSNIYYIWCNKKMKHWLYDAPFLLSLAKTSSQCVLKAIFRRISQPIVVFVGHVHHYVLSEGNFIFNHAWILTTDLCLNPICYLSSGTRHTCPGAPTRPCAYSWFLFLHFDTQIASYVGIVWFLYLKLHIEIV